MSRLEYAFPIRDVPDLNGDIRHMVVLSGHAERNPLWSLSSQVNPSAAYRLMEARMIHAKIPSADILISGGGAVPGIMKEVLEALGIAPEKIRTDSASFSNRQSAVNNMELLAGKPFYLVTSAGHMPRAMGCFRKVALNPVPVPTEYLSRKNIFSQAYLPRPRNLVLSDLAVQEYIGMIYYKLKGYI